MEPPLASRLDSEPILAAARADDIERTRRVEVNHAVEDSGHVDVTGWPTAIALPIALSEAVLPTNALAYPRVVASTTGVHVGTSIATQQQRQAGQGQAPSSPPLCAPADAGPDGPCAGRQGVNAAATIERAMATIHDGAQRPVRSQHAAQ